jgi:ankyrin repeat protein
MADDVIGSEDAVAEQARMFDTPGTPWYAVSKGTLEDIQKIWPATPCCRPHHKDASMETPCPVCGCTADVFARGPVGENVLHLAVLFHTPESVKMAKYLIERFGPSLVNAPYQTRARMTERPGLYEGEVALHIAIVHKDLELVRFMLQHGARLDTHTIGAFFGPGRVYFGETPFAFAASIGDRDIVKALLDHAAAQGGERKRLEVMTAVDAYGNTALHMCVKNNQLEMHDFLVDELGFPEDVRNNAGMTPFIMAANDGNQRAFSSILRRRFSVVWTYGPVTNYSLSLADIDTVGADPHAHDSSVIDVILKKNHLALLNHPILVAVLDMKWRAFGRAAFFKSIAFYVAFLAVFTWQVDMHATERAQAQWHSTSRTAVEWVTFGLSLAMLAQHARDLAYFCRAYYRQLHTLRVNSKDSEMPLYCLPGEKLDQRTNRMQLPRALRVVTPRRGTTFGHAGSLIAHAQKWRRGALSGTKQSDVTNGEGKDVDIVRAESGASVGQVSLRSISESEGEESDDGSSLRVMSDDPSRRPRRKSTKGDKSKSKRPRASPSMKRDLDNSRVSSSIDGFDAGEKNQRDSDAVYVLASSVVARRRWRLLREHWMSSYACVGLHQIARQMSLQHCDDYDDGVTVLLHVNVLEARGLAAADIDGRADPYCVVTAAPGARLRTKYQRKTLDPVWGQAFSFTAPPGIRRSGNKITLTVVDHDDFDFDDEMGVACVPFHDVPYVAPGMIPPGPVWLPLESRESNLSSEGVSGGSLSITAPIQRLEEMGRRVKDAGRAAVLDGAKKLERLKSLGPTSSGSGRPSAFPGTRENENNQLGEVLVEVYYEVRGVPESEKPGLGSSASAIVSAFASLAEKKEDGAAAMKARHTAFLRGIGTANQERALRRRLEKHGYVPLDEAPPPKKRGAAKNGGDDDGTKSGSDLDDSDDSDSAESPTTAPEGDEINVRLSGASDKKEKAFSRSTASARRTAEARRVRRQKLGGFWKRARVEALHARRAFAFYVNSVLIPQPSLFMNLTHIALQTVHFALWQSGSGPSSADDVVFAIAALAAWGFTLYFAAGYRSVGFLTVIVVGCIKDVVRFSSLWCVVLFAFSQAFYVLDASWADSEMVNGAAQESNGGQGDILWRLFTVAITAMPFDDVFPVTDTNRLDVKTAYTFLGLMFSVLMSMLMLNVIIAMFNQTYMRVSAAAHEQWRMQWALKILLAEAQLDVKTRFKLRLGEDAVGKNGEKTRVHNFEINSGRGAHSEGSLEEAVSALLAKKMEIPKEAFE